MRIFLSPQVSDDEIKYTFDGDKITATLDGATDTFDFSDFPDGELEAEEIETTLPVNPILSAKREDGVLSVELLNFIAPDESREEVLFPDWIDAEDYREEEKPGGKNEMENGGGTGPGEAESGSGGNQTSGSGETEGEPSE